MKKTLEIEQGRTVYLVHRQYGEEMQSLQQQVADCARKIMKDLEGNPLVDDLKYRLQAGGVLPQIPLDDVKLNMNMAGVLYFEWDEVETQPETPTQAPPPKTPETPPTKAPKKPKTKAKKADPDKNMTLEDLHEMAAEAGITEAPYGGKTELFEKQVAEREAAKAEVAKKAEAEAARKAKEEAAKKPKPAAAPKKATPPAPAPAPPPEPAPAPKTKEPEDDGMDEDLSSLFDTLDIPDDEDEANTSGDENAGEGGFSSPETPPMEQILKEADEFDLDDLIGQDLEDGDSD